MDVKEFIGLTKKSAQNKADAMSLTFRLIRIDNQEFFKMPEEAREDRICIEIDRGEVTKAIIH